MIYFERGENDILTWIHYMPFDPEFGLHKTKEELLETGYLVDAILEYTGEVPAGKMPELHYDGKEFSWVMVDRPVSEQDALRAELDALKAQLAEIQAVQTAQLGAEVMQNANL